MTFWIKEISKLWATLLGLALTALGTQALAQPTTDPEVVATAEEVFRAGRAAMKAGDYASACAKFEQSLSMQPALGTLLNLAVCEEKRGRLLLSVSHLHRFIDRAAIEDQRRPLAISYLTGVKLRLPQLTVQVSGRAPTDLKMELDGRPLNRVQLGRAIAVDPGPHVIAIVAPEHSRRRVQVQAFERRSVVHVIEFAGASSVPSASRARKPLPSSPPAEPSSNALAYWLAGAGLTSLAAGAVTGVIALRKKQTVDDHCEARGSQTLCDREGLDAIPEGRTFAAISTAATAIGLAGLGIGAYLHFSPHSGEHAAPRRVAGTRGMDFQLSVERAW